MLLCLLLILCACGYCLENCTHTQLYWSRNTTLWPENMNDTILCDTQWRDIMIIDTLKMSIPSNQYWVIASHQYITARLNKESTNTTILLVNDALIWLGDSLERVCDNISYWASENDILAYQMIDTLRQYNYGNVCQEDDNNTYIINALYYKHTADLLVIPESQSLASNKTSVFSLLGETYQYRQFTVSGVVIGCLVLIPVMTIIIILLLEKRRKYYLNKKKARKMPNQIKPPVQGYVSI